MRTNFGYSAVVSEMNQIDLRKAEFRQLRNLLILLTICRIWSLEGSDSDKNGFVFLLGVPSFHLQLVPNTNVDGTFFPSHNTAVDTYTYVSKFIDKSFLTHKRFADIIMNALLSISSANKLPFRVSKLGKYLEKEYQRLQLNIENKNLLRKFSLGSSNNYF